MNNINKKLYRSRKDKMLSGVIGGLGEYFNVDSTLLRLIWALVVVFTGIFPGVIVYIVAWVIVPMKPIKIDGIKIVEDEKNDSKKEEKETQDENNTN